MLGWSVVVTRFWGGAPPTLMKRGKNPRRGSSVGGGKCPIRSLEVGKGGGKGSLLFIEGKGKRRVDVSG